MLILPSRCAESGRAFVRLAFELSQLIPQSAQKFQHHTRGDLRPWGRAVVMLKYVSQFFLQIFPSIVATVVGAYIVNYYIVPKAQSDTKASYAKASPAGNDHGAIDVTPKNVTPKNVTPKDVTNKDVTSKDATGKDVTKDARGEAVTAKAAETKSIDVKSADTAKGEKPADAIRIIDLRRQPPREKAVARSTPAATPAAPASAPATETAALTPPATAEERRDRDANELARAAIERLRTSEPSRAAEAVKEPPREAAKDLGKTAEPATVMPREPAHPSVVAAVPPVAPRPLVQPLPPPVNVVAPAIETLPGRPQPSVAPTQAAADANRPIPPADIPGARPLDLQAAATPPRPTVADDVFSAARSVINAVVPQ